MLHETHRAWVEARAIDPSLAAKFGLATVERGGVRWLAVPYTERGETVNHKYRRTGQKDHRMDEGAPLALWNSDALSHPEVLSGSAVIITEGEWDALAAITAGLIHTVSVPNGAPGQRTSEPEKAKRYEWVWRHLEALEKVQLFILATDGDEAGRNLAHDLVALLGAERCRFVTYPGGCKDLNEVAIAHGHSAVVQIVNAAKPYPVQGLYKLDDFPPSAPLVHWSTGLPMLDEHIQMVPGTLTVFTGWANIGKSTVLSAILAAQIENHIPVAVASFETSHDILIDSLRQAMLRCSTYDLRRADKRQVDALIQENASFIHQAVDADEEMDLPRFLDLCRIAVLQHGARVIVLDPWNELEHKRDKNETETEYTNRALREFRRFAERFNVAFWVVAHPTKPQFGFKGAPKLYQIAGSAAWANKPHYGLTYHRGDPSANSGELHVTKVRQGMPGKKTDQAGIRVMLDYRSWTFVPDQAVA